MRIVLRPIITVIVVTVCIAATIQQWSTCDAQMKTLIPSTLSQRPSFQLRNLGMVAKLGKAKDIDDAQISLMKALGVQIVIWTPGEWAENETTQGQYRLNPEVRRVANEIAASDMKMALLLFRKNGLYRNPLDADAFARYCAWLATTFRGMPVAAYHEPSNFDVREYYGGAWNGRGNAPWVSKFSDMVEKAAQAIKQADPSATITTSFEGPPLIDAMEDTPQDFASIDGISFHPYPGKLPAERVPWGGSVIYLRDGVSVADSQGSLVSTLDMQRHLDAERYLKRPLQAWVTEYGFPTCDQSIHVGFDERTDAGIDRGQYAALVFACLRPDVAGQLDTELDAAAGDGVTNRPLVRRVTVTVQAYDDRDLDPGGLKFAGGTQDRVGIERLDLLSVGIQPPGDLAHQRTWHQGRRPPGIETHGMRHGQALKLEQIAEASGHQQSDAGALALDQRVRRDRTAVGMDHPVPRRTL